MPVRRNDEGDDGGNGNTRNDGKQIKLNTSESEPCGQEFSFRSHKSTRITSMIKVNTKPVAVPGITTRWGGRVLTGMEAVVVVWLALVLRILSGGTTSAQSLKPPATLRTCDEATQAPCFPTTPKTKECSDPYTDSTSLWDTLG